MDGTSLGFFLAAAFMGGFASGLAGFAMGFVVSGVWLHILTPIQTTCLIVGYGLLTQGYGVWKLRDALAWDRIAPFILGAIVGVPFGTLLLTFTNPTHMRTGVGVLLIVYSLYGLTQPTFSKAPDSKAADTVIGAVNGVLAGLTGLPGFVVTIWCQLRGWTKDVQRAVFQPAMLAAILINVASLAAVGAITDDVVRLYLLGLPAMVAGIWIGFRLYGKLDEAAFRKLVLVLLFASGVALIAAQAAPLLTR